MDDTQKAQGKKITIAELNGLPQGDFVQILGSVFEHSPWIAQTAWKCRPFADFGDLHRTLCNTVKDSDEESRLSLIRAHPDLVGHAALAGTLTRESTGEQAIAGLNQLTPEETALFQRHNADYQAKFGFPFIICARLNKKEAILAGFAHRLKNSREQEIKTALEEIFKIAELRLRDRIAA